MKIERCTFDKILDPSGLCKGCDLFDEGGCMLGERELHYNGGFFNCGKDDETKPQYIYKIVKREYVEEHGRD